MSDKILIASLVNDFGLGGTPRQIVTVDTYLNKDIFEHIVIGLDSNDNARRKHFGRDNVFSCQTPEEVVGVLRAHNIDILHAHRHGRNEPSHDRIASLWGPDHIFMDLNIFSAYDPGVFGQYCQRHIFPSCTNVLKYCIQNNISFDADKHHVLYTLFDSAHFATYTCGSAERALYRQTRGIPESAFVVGRLARPVMEKWDDEMLLMWKKLSRSNRDIYFIALGVPDSRKKRLQAIGDSRRLVMLEPTTSDQDLALFYSSIDVLAHASPIGECSSGTLMEAMFFKKPIVVITTPFPRSAGRRDHTRDNGQVEQIQNGVNGYVVKDGAAMATALDRLFGESTLVQTMSEQNHREVLERYDVRVGIQTLEKIYLFSMRQKYASLTSTQQGYFDALTWYPAPTEIARWPSEYERRLTCVYQGASNSLVDRAQLAYWRAEKIFRRFLNLV